MLSTKPLISVIVPVFNTGSYLKDCIESVLNQDYPSIELVIIDDASSDAETLQILQEYEERENSVLVQELGASNQTVPVEQRRVHVTHLEHNQGLSHARNTGVSYCHGEYFIFLDSDDLLVQGAISKLWAAISQYYVDLVICQIENFSDVPNVDLNFEAVKVELPPNKFIDLAVFAREQKLFSFPITAYGKLINTQRYQESGNYFEQGRIFEDADWGTRLALGLKSAVYIDVIGCKRRLRANSITANVNASNRLDMFKSQSSVWRAIKDHGFDRLYKDEFVLSSFGGFEYRFNLMTDKNLKQLTVAKMRDFFADLDIKLPAKPNRLYCALHHVLYKITTNTKQKSWHKIAYHYARMYLKCH